MANPWFKFYGMEYLGDPKMDAFDGNERSCWLTILSLASQSDDGWVLYTEEEKLLERSGIRTHERPIYSGVLAKYEKFEMLECRNGDVTQGFRPKNWEKRQYSEGYSRVKKFRESRRNENETAEITIEENREDKKRIDKSIYGELQKVKLTTEEYNKLVEKLGERNIETLIEELDTYIGSTGKRYSSHYATLLNWARRKSQEKRSNPKTKTFVI